MVSIKFILVNFFKKQRPVSLLHGQRRQMEELGPAQLVHEPSLPQRQQVEARRRPSLDSRRL